MQDSAASDPAHGTAEEALRAAKSALEAGDSVLASRHAAQGFALAQQQACTALSVEAAVLLGKCHMNLDQCEQAAHWCKTAIELDTEGCHRPMVATAWVVLGSARGGQGRTAEAVQAVSRGATLLDDGATPREKNSCFTGVSMLYERLGLVVQTLGAVTQALDVAEMLPDVVARFRSRCNWMETALKAIDFYRQQDDLEADALLKRCREQVETLTAEMHMIGSAHARVRHHWLRAHVAMACGDAAAALDWADAGLADAASADEPPLLQELLLARGRALAAQGRMADMQIVVARMAASFTHHASEMTLEELRRFVLMHEMAGCWSEAVRWLEVHQARVMHNSYVVQEAQMAETVAQLSAHTMKLEIDALRHQAQTLHQRQGALSAMAYTDALCGLPNRRAFEAHCFELRMAAEPQRLWVLDIDHFKDVNDRFGHLVGDEVLRLTAQQLAAVFASHGQVFRYGGEEFTAITDDAGPQAAAALAQAVREQLAAVEWSLWVPGRTVTISGGTVVSCAEEPLQAALARADALLYAAKAQGRDRIAIDLPTALGEASEGAAP